MHSDPQYISTQKHDCERNLVSISPVEVKLVDMLMPTIEHEFLILNRVS